MPSPKRNFFKLIVLVSASYFSLFFVIIVEVGKKNPKFSNFLMRTLHVTNVTYETITLGTIKYQEQ